MTRITDAVNASIPRGCTFPACANLGGLASVGSPFYPGGLPLLVTNDENPMKPTTETGS